MNLPKALSLYSMYKMNWMVEHGITVDDLIEELDNYREATETDVEYNSIEDVAREWEANEGFGGELWACYDEWFDTEFYEELMERISDKLDFWGNGETVTFRTPMTDYPEITIKLDDEDDAVRAIADFVAFGEHAFHPYPVSFYNLLVEILWKDNNKGVDY